MLRGTSEHVEVRSTYRKPEEVHDPRLQRSQRIVQRRTDVPLDVVDQEGKPVPTLSVGKRIPEDGLVQEGNGGIEAARVG